MSTINTDPTPLSRIPANQTEKTGIKPASRQSANAFQGLLEEKMDAGPDRPDNVEKTEKLPELSSAAPVITSEIKMDDTAARIGRSLDLLDAYAVKLGDPGWNAKDLSPLLNTISREMETLSRELEQAPSSTGEMASLLGGILSTVRVEQIKLARGDYTDQV